MQSSPLQRARAKEFTMACIVENLAVLNGEKTEEQAVEDLCARFFPETVGANKKRQEES